ncbi:MAG: guanylate kinase [Planctomycetaceae bacterium]|jgi:guanylate kinase|nr:guanylate kinase [Planctomycetaceae bacterium]
MSVPPQPQHGKLLIVSGPSGVGKGTLLKRVFAESSLPLVLSVSATTRKPRTGETDGVHYHFITSGDFENKRCRGDFLECFEVFGTGTWYGTLRKEVETALAAGRWVVLEIDVKGAKAVKEQFPDAVMLFVKPKNIEVLKERLAGRGTETKEAMWQRLSVALDELRHADEFEHQIVNDDLDAAVGQFIDILKQRKDNN